MKHLSPTVSCLLTVHMKPCVGDVLAGLVNQTRKDFHILTVDSGQWIGKTDPTSAAMEAAYVEYHAHPLVEWIFTAEPPDLIRRKCPVGWVFNEVIRAGLIRGRYMFTAYDDDLHEPVFVERMAGFLDEHPEHRAVYCSQARVSLSLDGTSVQTGVIPATGMRHPGTWDCQVDGGQIMWHTSVLDSIGDPWLTEDPTLAVCRHSDGLFLESLARVVGPVPGLPEILTTHRNTPWSTYSPS